MAEGRGTDLPGPGAGLVLPLMLTLWKEESREPVSCRKSFREVTLFIGRTLGFGVR